MPRHGTMTMLKLVVACPLLLAMMTNIKAEERSALQSAKPQATTVERTGPSHGKAKRILFLGNSITLHGPSAKVGWPNNWGMAASAQEKDYVHLLLDSMAKLSGSQPEARITNIADFERHYDTYDLDSGLKQDLDFKPDMVVVAIGENVSALVSEESKTKFKARFARLLSALKKSGQPAIFVRSCFWADKAKDDILRESSAAAGGVFVDISGLSKDESNYARSERSFAHAGVANHPGDKGMKAIADALLKAVASQTTEGQQNRERAPRP
jgi:lysophospholipase L1-like esterase